ncbi:inositol monophosphatase family protein [Marinobacter psychrophilus]|jgi:myo-inositol-1(or 4)-monophosphatase|uniref:inositol monophosphatase family protein n=1 Tax=Marinobacter psychrophilus TaxID=330734 RepID=UPI001B70E635|nr:inositol monophosphatase family protein [Marinobacter psychrophilus]MBQ0764285.1 inositol monophosphatase [Marinobacter psychrophilus]MBQ0845065.1 inositol monophosphatase [Marinobacter psychrophilus]
MSDSISLHEITDFAQALALEAGELIRHERDHNTLRTDYKQQTELVTHADIMADEFITGAIRKRFPEHRILSEETMPDLTQAEHIDTPLWVIDPIDGTVNYAYGHPQVAVSIAYAERGQVQAGIVHAPFAGQNGKGETFRATRGDGATLNGQAIRHSNASELRQALFATGFPYTKDALEPLLKRLDAMIHQCRDLRRMGSAALDICWVACGRLDVYYENVSPWDFAAARLIAIEAGAHAGHFGEVPENQPADLWGKDILISSPKLWLPVREILRKASGY